MLKKNGEEAEVKNFEVEQILPGHPKHKRHAFSFTVEEMNLKDIFTKVKLRG